MLKMGCDVDGVIGDLVMAPVTGRLYEGALAWMSRPYAMGTTWWQEKQWLAERKFGYGRLLEWEAAFVARFAKLGVPVHCDRFVLPVSSLAGASPGLQKLMQPYVDGYACDLVHSTIKDMPPICWEIFRHVGEELAEQVGLDVVWRGPQKPWAWVMAEAEDWHFNPPVLQDYDVQRQWARLRSVPL